MQTFWRAALILLVTVVSLAVAFIAVALVVSALDLTPGSVPEWATTLVIAGMVGLPLGAAFVVARTLARRMFPGARLSWSKQSLRAVAVAYAITAMFGAPACQTYRSQWAVAEYKRLRAGGDSRVWEIHPRIATYAAIPILPAVVLEYHEYQLAGLYGFGGFELFVWYGSGVKSLGQLPLWLS